MALDVLRSISEQGLVYSEQSPLRGLTTEHRLCLSYVNFKQDHATIALQDLIQQGTISGSEDHSTALPRGKTFADLQSDSTSENITIETMNKIRALLMTHESAGMWPVLTEKANSAATTDFQSEATRALLNERLSHSVCFVFNPKKALQADDPAMKRDEDPLSLEAGSEYDHTCHFWEARITHAIPVETIYAVVAPAHIAPTIQTIFPDKYIIPVADTTRTLDCSFLSVSLGGGMSSLFQAAIDSTVNNCELIGPDYETGLQAVVDRFSCLGENAHQYENMGVHVARLSCGEDSSPCFAYPVETLPNEARLLDEHALGRWRRESEETLLLDPQCLNKKLSDGRTLRKHLGLHTWKMTNCPLDTKQEILAQLMQQRCTIEKNHSMRNTFTITTADALKDTIRPIVESLLPA